MNRTKIDWADMTWNPVTGCLNGCEYCYAKRLVDRFGGDSNELPDNRLHILEEPHYDAWSGQKRPYSFGFDPTFHRYRLDEPSRMKEPQNIFVCSMADLFGHWVPEEWIQEVFKACEATPQHRYLFLTKNPNRYLELYDNKRLPYKNNFWFGTTCTKPSDDFAWVRNTPYKAFVSIEPILKPFGTLENGECPDWVIVGAETGNRKGKVVPKRVWVEDIAKNCRENNIPLFMKESLREIMGADFRQEFPWEDKP